VFRLDDGARIKPAYSTVAGAWSSESSPNHRYPRLLRLLKLAVVVGVLMGALGYGAWEVDVVLGMAAGMVVGVERLLWALGRRRAKQLLLDKTGGRLHEAIEVCLCVCVCPALRCRGLDGHAWSGARSHGNHTCDERG
jgi:hypothetical protein